MAEEAGIFTKHGLDVDLKYFESYLDSLTALATGNVDGNSQTLNDTISSVSGGSKQSIVLVNDNSTGNDQIIVAPGIAKVEDLKGKTVAIEEGTVDHYLLLLGLQQAGMKPEDIDLKPLPTADAAAAFAAGQVDAVGAFAPFTDTAITREGSKVLFSSADFPGAIPDHLVMDTAFVKSRPADVQKLVDAWYDTLDYIGANPDESIAIMAKRAGVTDDAYRAYDAGTTIFTVAENIEAFAPGTDQKHLDFVARQIVDLLLDHRAHRHRARPHRAARPHLRQGRGGRWVTVTGDRVGVDPPATVTADPAAPAGVRPAVGRRRRRRRGAAPGGPAACPDAPAAGGDPRPAPAADRGRVGRRCRSSCGWP